MKALIVEDDFNLRSIIKEETKKYFTEVEAASNGQAGYHAFKQNKIDLVVSDMQMPIMNGEQMARKIRSTENGKKAVIILHTGAPGTCKHPELFDHIISKGYPEGLRDLLKQYSKSK